MSGYVRLYRSLIGHPAFRNESETMAFAWLVAKAAWKPIRVRYKGHSINLKRGQVAISQRDMATAFDRDKAWIERLWRRCKSEAMIEVASEAGVAVITVCNYDEYQAESDASEAPRKAPREAANEADARQTRGTEQRREEGNKSSVSNDTGASADSDQVFWANAKAFLAPETKGDPGKLIGAWCRDYGKRETADAITRAQIERPFQRVPFIIGCLKQSKVKVDDGREWGCA